MTRQSRADRIEAILGRRLWTSDEAAEIHRRFLAGEDTAALARAYDTHESQIVRALDQHRAMGKP